MIEQFDPHWTWLALGLGLAIAEIAIPGVFLIWLSLAALVTGLLTWVLPVGVPLQVGLFAILAIASVFVGRKFLRSHPVKDADPLMNRRGARAVGQLALVTQAIEGGEGRIRLGDSEWLAQGPDTPVGARVRITGSDGAILMVALVE